MAGTLYSFVDQEERYIHITDHTLLLNNVAPKLRPIRIGSKYNENQNTVTVTGISITTLACETPQYDEQAIEIITGKVFPFSVQVFIYCEVENQNDYCAFFDPQYWLINKSL